MTWLKQHWKILAAIAVGIPVVYWLYQSYLAKQETNQTDATLQNQEQQDQAAYAQQVALGNVNQGFGGGSGGVSSSQNPTNTATSPPVSPVASTPAPSVAPDISTIKPGATSTAPAPGMVLAPNGVWVEPGALAPLTPTVADTSQPQTGILTRGTGDNTPSPTLTSTLFGGGNIAQKTPVTQNSTAILAPAHISDGTIASHQTYLPTPTTVELASLGSRR